MDYSCKLLELIPDASELEQDAYNLGYKQAIIDKIKEEIKDELKQ